MHLFPNLAFQQAIGCLETISSKTEDKAMHDKREKAQRDYDDEKGTQCAGIKPVWNRELKYLTGKV